jgi:hypothetical protein
LFYEQLGGRDIDDPMDIAAGIAKEIDSPIGNKRGLNDR